jgi:hypothetical protein
VVERRPGKASQHDDLLGGLQRVVAARRRRRRVGIESDVYASALSSRCRMRHITAVDQRQKRAMDARSTLIAVAIKRV